MYRRLAVVLAILAVALGRDTMEIAAGLEVQIRNTHAGPKLYVNGEPRTPTVLFVNLHDVADPVHTPLQLGEVETAGRYGVNLVSLTIGMPWPRDGEPANWAASADRWIEMALQANPNALLIPRIPVTYPPDRWFQEHPDERMLYDDGAHGLPSVHSEVWRRDAARHLKALVEHLEAKYGDHILAYHPSGQHTGEWFYDRMWEGRTASFEPPARTGFLRFLKAKYGSDDALRRAWRDNTISLASADIPCLEERGRATRGVFRDPVAERKVIDFDEFRNVDMADAVAQLCQTIKQAAPRSSRSPSTATPLKWRPRRPGYNPAGISRCCAS